MKNEPIVAYNHLQEEENEKSGIMHESHSASKGNWRMWVTPFAIAIEIAAVVAMAFYMIEEIFR